MKNIILSVVIAFSSFSFAQSDIVQLPNLSMIKTATVLEIMEAISRQGNKVLWLCSENIKAIVSNKPNARLSPVCRSELNKLITKDVQSDGPDIKGLAEKITEDAITDSDKLLAIYKWVTTNISYDVATYMVILKEKKIFENPLDLISASKTLKRKTAICEGYALLTAALLRAVGIPAVTIVGLAIKDNEAQGSHAWNEAYIDDRWVNLDTTWDAGGVTGNLQQGLTFVSRPSMKHFDMPDVVFKKTHKAIIDIK